MSDYRDCPVDGCTNTHHRSKLMCLAHWRSLPKPLRDELWQAYRLEGVISDRYIEAREDCLAFCEGRPPREATSQS